MDEIKDNFEDEIDENDLSEDEVKKENPLDEAEDLDDLAEEEEEEVDEPFDDVEDM